MKTEITEITDANVETLDGFNGRSIILDFYAEWCGPCKVLGGILHEVQEEMGDQVTVVKANIENNDKLLKKYHVETVPTVVLLKNGEEVKRQVGLKTKKDLLDDLSEVM